MRCARGGARRAEGPGGSRPRERWWRRRRPGAALRPPPAPARASARPARGSELRPRPRPLSTAPGGQPAGREARGRQAVGDHRAALPGQGAHGGRPASRPDVAGGDAAAPLPAGPRRGGGSSGGGRRRGAAAVPGLALRVLLLHEPAAPSHRLPAAHRHGRLPRPARRLLRARAGEWPPRGSEGTAQATVSRPRLLLTPCALPEAGLARARAVDRGKVSLEGFAQNKVARACSRWTGRACGFSISAPRGQLCAFSRRRCPQQRQSSGFLGALAASHPCPRNAPGSPL